MKPLLDLDEATRRVLAPYADRKGRVPEPGDAPEDFDYEDGPISEARWRELTEAVERRLKSATEATSRPPEEGLAPSGRGSAMAVAGVLQIVIAIGMLAGDSTLRESVAPILLLGGNILLVGAAVAGPIQRIERELSTRSR